MVRENRVSVDNLIQPIFLVQGKNINEQIESLPVVNRMSIDQIINQIGECIDLGIQSFIMFPSIPEEKKDKIASYSYDPANFYLEAAKTIKSKYPNITLISDVAMDPYNIDGHDGYVQNGQILNDKTLPILNKMAIAQAEAGFDILGPSDMMDGRIGEIRQALDNSGYTGVGIMSYTAKYCSALYGPFRVALDSAPKGGDKKTYQMDPANKLEALIEGELDDSEGADYLMVKPALHYLDVIHLLKDSFAKPIAAYHVSGECAMLCAAVKKGWLDYQQVMPETLLCLKRAGADAIITYFAKEYALIQQGKPSEWLKM
jgi:porphobilinogen synthase